MSFLNVLTNLTKASVAIVVTPVAVVADVFSLPASAESNKPTFGMTAKMLNAAGNCISEAVKPTEGQTK